jgi:excisionase family DNA binding protein
MFVEHYKRITAVVDAVMNEKTMHEAKPTSHPVKPVSTVSPSQRLLSVKEFGALLGVSLWTVRAWAYRGRVASVKLGARMMIPTAELDRLISENMRPALSRDRS